VRGNLLEGSDPPDTGERFEPLGKIGTVSLERIVSSAQPEPGEYEQAHDEWVLLVRGTARDAGGVGQRNRDGPGHAGAHL
jgi:cupin 2 domain-containing protein